MKPRQSQTIPEAVKKAALQGEFNEVLMYVNDLTVHQRRHLHAGDGKTLIHFACMCANATLLFELHARYNLPLDRFDYCGTHPMHVAAARGHMNLLEYLLDNGCSPTVLDGDGKAPVWHADVNHHNEVVSMLEMKGGGNRDATAALAELRSNSLYATDAEMHLYWREAESALKLSRNVLITPLPWAAVPERNKVVVSFARTVSFVAGMLLVDGEFQFDGTVFAEGLTFKGPATSKQDISCCVYECLSVPQCYVHVFRSSSKPHVLVRCSASTSAETPVAVAAEARTPDATEQAALLKLSHPQEAETLLSRPLHDLEDAVSLSVRIYKRTKHIRHFRGMMLRVHNSLLCLRKFMRRCVTRKKMGVIVTRARILKFFDYAERELSQLHVSNYQQIREAIKSTTPSQRDAAVFAAIDNEKRAFYSKRGLLARQFSYMIPLDGVFRVLIDSVDISAVVQSLSTRSCLLPRSTMAQLHRNPNAAFNTKTLAHRRTLAVMIELGHYMIRGRSYAEEMKDTERVASIADMSRIKQQRKLAAATSTCTGQTDDSPPVVEPVTSSGRAGATSISAPQQSRESAASMHAEKQKHVPKTRVPETSPTHAPTASPFRYRYSPAKQLRPRRPATAQTILQCDARSPIPRLVGSRAALRGMLLSGKLAMMLKSLEAAAEEEGEILDGGGEERPHRFGGDATPSPTALSSDDEGRTPHNHLSM